MTLKGSFEDGGHKPVPIKMFFQCILQTGPVHRSTKSAVGDESLCLPGPASCLQEQPAPDAPEEGIKTMGALRLRIIQPLSSSPLRKISSYPATQDEMYFNSLPGSLY